jgi:hypothetical protein
MSKNFKKGIDNVFSPTRINEVSEPAEEGMENESDPVKTNDIIVSYNVRYPKSLQKRIKRFCIDHDGTDMKDVFTQGAIMYMESSKKNSVAELID